MVTQDTSLLHRTVLDNILYGRPDAGAPEAMAAAKKAAAHEFIGQLVDYTGPTGYDAHVGERGGQRSGGRGPCAAGGYTRGGGRASRAGSGRRTRLNNRIVGLGSLQRMTPDAIHTSYE